MRHNDGYYVLVMANIQRLLICLHFMWASTFLLISLWTLPEAGSKESNLHVGKIFFCLDLYNSIFGRDDVSYNRHWIYTCGGGCIILDTCMIFALKRRKRNRNSCFVGIKATNCTIPYNWQTPAPNWIYHTESV